MPVFEYKALDGRGKTVEGLKEADSPKTLRATLRRENIFLTEVLGQKEAAAAKKREVSVRRFVGSRISTRAFVAQPRSSATSATRASPWRTNALSSPKTGR